MGWRDWLYRNSDKLMLLTMIFGFSVVRYDQEFIKTIINQLVGAFLVLITGSRDKNHPEPTQ